MTVSVEDSRAGHTFGLAVARDRALDASHTLSPLPPTDLASTSREQERNARRRYQAAVAAALETLRYAEQHFAKASSAIDAHIQRARAAAADRAIRRPIQATGTSTARETTDAWTAAPMRSHVGRSIPSPVRLVPSPEYAQPHDVLG